MSPKHAPFEDESDALGETAQRLAVLPTVLAVDRLEHDPIYADALEVTTDATAVPPKVSREVSRAGMAIVPQSPKTPATCNVLVTEYPLTTSNERE